MSRRIDELLAAMTTEEKVAMVTGGDSLCRYRSRDLGGFGGPQARGHGSSVAAMWHTRGVEES